jgi:dTDP-4-dehydrorhamnose 3,5-epimerase
MDSSIVSKEIPLSIDGFTLTPLKLIGGDKGRVMHGIKATDDTYAGFGEAYFSEVLQTHIKGWKRHNRMVLNLVVPVGAIKFYVFDDRVDSPTKGQHLSIVLGTDHNYSRLTIRPGLWVAFEGVGEGQNLLMNFASIPHDPTEADAIPLGTEGFPVLPC